MLATSGAPLNSAPHSMRLPGVLRLRKEDRVDANLEITMASLSSGIDAFHRASVCASDDQKVGVGTPINSGLDAGQFDESHDAEVRYAQKCLKKSPKVDNCTVPTKCRTYL